MEKNKLKKIDLIAEIERIEKELANERSHNKKVLKNLNKGFDDFIGELRTEVSGASDEKILEAWNKSIPEEAFTTDINKALRGSRMFMNAVAKQKIADLKLIATELK